MEEKDLILEEVVTPMEETENKEEVIVLEALPKKPKNNFKNNGFKNKECKVIAYNKRTNTLDVKFDNYGIRIKDVKEFTGDTVELKYKGEIGKPNFEYKM